tara:strand:+ start:1062 stop:1349 length:288 start_codon:yes stop_codon:yes gene_type:complete
MRLLIILLLLITACDLKLPVYKLADETRDLKYHKLIPTHSLPLPQGKKSGKIASTKSKSMERKITTLECKSKLLKTKNKYTGTKLKELLKDCTKK